MRICILGVSGLLGQAALRVAAEDPLFDRVCGVARRPFAPDSRTREMLADRYIPVGADLAENGGIPTLQSFRPDFVLNCAALVDLAGCERDPASAERLNAGLPETVGKHCAEKKIRLAHVSTDQVFDGSGARPYAESDAPNPLHAYGRTKLAGEQRLLKVCPGALVVRANIVGVRGRREAPTFGEWLCGALVGGQEITLAEDFLTSPVTARFLAQTLVKALQKNLNGIYHIGSAAPISKYDFGKAAAEKLGVSFDRVKRGRIADLNLVPRRPGYLALDPRALESAAGMRMPTGARTAEELAQEYLIWRKTWDR